MTGMGYGLSVVTMMGIEFYGWYGLWFGTLRPFEALMLIAVVTSTSLTTHEAKP